HISGFDGFDAGPLTAELARLDPSSILTKENNELIVSFDRAQARIAAVVQAIMQSCDILDYTVEETPIDDIVRRIYSEARQP
ncbi:MAG TPA: hypothetical protein DCG47_15455, partial [Spirochaetaceae bacterium]|nr:hypothetical protein [Spirochaetaceae bacterium]